MLKKPSAFLSMSFRLCFEAMSVVCSLRDLGWGVDPRGLMCSMKFVFLGGWPSTALPRDFAAGRCSLSITATTGAAVGCSLSPRIMTSTLPMSSMTSPRLSIELSVHSRGWPGLSDTSSKTPSSSSASDFFMRRLLNLGASDEVDPADVMV